MTQLEYKAPMYKALIKLVPSTKGEYDLHVVHDKGTIKKFHGAFELFKLTEDDKLSNSNEFRDATWHDLHGRNNIITQLAGISRQLKLRSRNKKEDRVFNNILSTNIYYADNGFTFTEAEELEIRPQWKKLELRSASKFKKIIFPENCSLKKLSVTNQVDIEGDPKDCHIEIETGAW